MFFVEPPQKTRTGILAHEVKSLGPSASNSLNSIVYKMSDNAVTNELEIFKKDSVQESDCEMRQS